VLRGTGSGQQRHHPRGSLGKLERRECLTEEEAHEHHTEQKCPRCGRKLDERHVINAGGLRERPGPQVRETSPDLSEELLQNNLMEQCACNSMTAVLSASLGYPQDGAAVDD